MMTFKVQPASKRMSVQSFLQRSLMMMAAIMAALVTFVACGDDDDKNPVEVESVTINQPAAGVELVAGGSSITLSVTIEPANATNKSVTWSSSDNTIATVSNGGVVTGLKPGTVTITATTKSGNISDNITLTVKANGSSGGVEGKRLSSYIVSSSENTLRSEYSYNSDGTLKRIDNYDEKTSKLFQYVIITNYPDGTIQKQEQYLEDFPLITVWNFTNDTNKKPLERQGTTSMDGVTIGTSTADFTFQNGRQIRQVVKDYTGNVLQQETTYEHNYGSDGRRTTTVQTTTNGPSWQHTRTYNDDGTLQKVNSTSSANDTQTITFTWENGNSTTNFDDYAQW